MIGASVHDPDRARAAKQAGADFIVFGPIFATPEKSPKGIEPLVEVCSELDGFPIIAVGGIDGSNFQKVLDVGAAGFAAIRYLNDLEVLKKLR
jgi:thiamine monophosphate synthase